MDLSGFRSLCADPAKDEQDILAYIMDAKREHGEFSPETKAEVCSILNGSRWKGLAEKLCRNLDRRSKLR